MKLTDFVCLIYALCKIYNASVTSWLRSPAHNKMVGGVANSKHLEGLAVDINVDDPTNRDPLINAARTLKLRAFWDKDHIHIETI
jgi:uncharacterized protein YcbK (DUF882 family)